MCSGGGCLCTSQWQDCIHMLQQQHREAPVIVAGDMNQCKLDITMPGFKQKGQTKKSNLLDKCFVNVEGPYVSRIRPPAANSGDNLVHLVPIYNSKLKSSKPEKKSKNRLHRFRCDTN